jgi:hypothetical protein
MARKAGEETEAGVSRPPERTVKSAGRRILSCPGAGALPVAPGVPGPGPDDVVALDAVGVAEVLVLVAETELEVAGALVEVWVVVEE